MLVLFLPMLGAVKRVRHLLFNFLTPPHNFRKPNAWFDYQFIGSSQSGVVGRSEKIEQQVTYTFDCP